MNIFKERIIGAITVMKDKDLEKLWYILNSQFNNDNWDNIEEVEPDEIDLKMLDEIETNPDCKVFISGEETLEMLGLSKEDLLN